MSVVASAVWDAAGGEAGDVLNGMESTGCRWLQLVERRIIFTGHGRRNEDASLGARGEAHDGRCAGSVVDYGSLSAKHMCGTIER